MALRDSVFVDRKRGVLGRCLDIPALEVSRPLSIYSAVGLSLLYASAYFLPFLMPTGSYFLPSYDYLDTVGWPSFVCIGVCFAVIYLGALIARRVLPPRVATILAIATLCIFTLIALKSVMYAAGYDWPDRIPHKGSLVAAQRIFKVLVALAVVTTLWSARHSLTKINRALASLGFGFLGLAVVRLVILSQAMNVGTALPPATGPTALHPLVAKTVPSDARQRRVVWIIFDETDFERLFGSLRSPQLQVPNFDRLKSTSVFANNANSPASATLFSLPALLTGTPLTGSGLQIDTYGRMSLQSAIGDRVVFDEANSVFGAVSAGGRGVSALGFLHPYCKVFATQHCESMPWPHVGALDDALWSNIPGVLSTRLGRANSWESMTDHLLRVLPEYLTRNDALTFVHLDIPHLPSAYAEAALHLPASKDPLVNYSHNLELADQVLGKVMAALQPQSEQQDVLLIVSTDHWLRKVWYRPDEPESSSPIPLMMWRVGETQGTVLSEPLSTVHTASLILSYLSGEISTQSDIALWWTHQVVYPSFIGPNT